MAHRVLCAAAAAARDFVQIVDILSVNTKSRRPPPNQRASTLSAWCVCVIKLHILYPMPMLDADHCVEFSRNAPSDYTRIYLFLLKMAE